MIIGENALRRDTMICRMARELPDGAACIRGLGTPLSAVAINVAVIGLGKSIFTITTEGGFIMSGATEIAMTPTSSTGRRVLVSFAELILELVPRYQPFEFMRPAQLDRHGRSNNVRIERGSSPLFLPGCGGIADATSVNGNLVYYLPRHDRRTLVDDVDFCSGGARSIPAGRLPIAPARTITELCVIEWSSGRPTMESMHPGVTVEDVVGRTGFELIVPDRPVITPPPSADETRALALVDPNRLRDLEFEAGDTRREALRRAIAV